MKRRLAILATVVMCVAAHARPGAGADDRAHLPAPMGTAGEFLVASPGLTDPRFSRTVIYMIAHDAHGAMGLVVNRSYGEGPLSALLSGFGVEPTDRTADVTVSLHYGGPVEPGRGFVLHSADYQGPSTRTGAGGRIAVSTGTDVLTAVAGGTGPKQRLFILGYAGWSAGQLDGEIAAEDWLTAPADVGLLFADNPDTVWERAMHAAGWAL
jgi:putative transcriptional regulator